MGMIHLEHQLGGGSGAVFEETVGCDGAVGGVVFEDGVESLGVAVEVG